MARRAALVDDSTGEVLDEGYLNFQSAKKRMPFRMWMFVNAEIATALKRLTHITDLKVFCTLLGKMRSENLVHLSNREIAEESDLSAPQVSRSLKRLAEEKFIFRTDKEITVNPDLLWRGELRKHPKNKEKQNV